MERQAASWRYDEKYGGKFHDGTFENWAEKQSASFPYGHRDGVSIWVAPVDVNPDDRFLD